jgi:hypothetical protein
MRLISVLAPLLAMALLPGAAAASVPKAKRPQAAQTQAPTLTPAQKQRLTRLRAKIGASKYRKLELKSQSFGRAIARAIDFHAHRGKKLNPARPPRKLKRQLGQLVEIYASTTGEQNVAELTNAVVSLAIQGFAAKVQGNNALKANLREAISTLREEALMLQDLIDDSEDSDFPMEVTYTEVFMNADGSASTREKRETFASKEPLKALKTKFESQITELEQMLEELASEQKDAMTKQAQVIQTMSAIMKNQHDTLKAIIQNIRG